MHPKMQALQIRLTEQEHDAFIHFAESLGENRSRIIRKLIRELVTYDIDLLTDEKALLRIAIRQLVGIANNLNQITKTINAGIVVNDLQLNQTFLEQLHATVIDIKTALQNHVLKTQQRWMKCVCPIKNN